MADYYDVERKGNGFRVTPGEGGGCGTVIGAIVLFLIIAIFVHFSGDTGHSTVDQDGNGGSPTTNSTGNSISDQNEEGNYSGTNQNETEGTKHYPEKMNLTDLHVLGTHSTVLDNIVDKGTAEDAYGKTYAGPYFDLCSYGNYGGEIDTQAYTDLVAGENYQYLSGTFFARANQNENYTIEFFIYADNELVFSSGPINRRTKPIDFTVDIGNCDIIRVMSSSTDYTCWDINPGIILVNASVHN